MGSSNQLNNDDIRYLSLLLGIISTRNWKAFGYAMLKNPTVFQSLARSMSQSTDLNGMTILHACVRFDPPPRIVKILLSLIPEAPSCVDCLQRTPLHVAAGTQASLPLIQLLAEAYPRACDIQDEDGKTPLHLSCDIECEIFEGDEDSKREPPSYEVVQTLLKASASSVTVEDQDGMNALEHAILSHASIKVVKLLQYTTRKQCEANKKTGESIKELGPLMKKNSPSQDSMFEHEPDEEIFIPVTKGVFSSRRVIHRDESS